jgi:ankyrin repeat protein
MEWRQKVTIRDVDRNLILACKVNKVQDAREAIEAGADLEAVNERFEAPLVAALWRSGAEILNLLLDRGATVPESVKQNEPSYEDLRKRVKGRPYLALALGRLGHRFAPDDVEMSFADHVRAGNLEDVRRAIAARPDHLLETDPYAAGPLGWAVGARQLEVARVLLDLGAAVDAPGGYPRGTPLMHALWNHDVAMARLLVERGANLNVRCDHGICHEPETPLHIAAAEGLVEALQLLGEHGADDTVLHEGRTALDLAREGGHEAAVAWLEAQAKKQR